MAKLEPTGRSAIPANTSGHFGPFRTMQARPTPYKVQMPFEQGSKPLRIAIERGGTCSGLQEDVLSADLRSRSIGPFLILFDLCGGFHGCPFSQVRRGYSVNSLAIVSAHWVRERAREGEES